MRTYAIWGTPTSPEHEAWVRSIGRAFETDGFEQVEDVAEADFVLNMFDAEQPEGVSPPVARHLLGLLLRARTRRPTTCSSELPDARPHARERRRAPRAGRRRLVHDDGAGHVPDHRRPGGRLRAARAAREVEARDRQRVRPRPRARALGRRRGHRRHRSRRQADAASSTSCRRRSRSTSSSTSATCATSCASTRSAGSPTATSRPARTRPASG